MDEINKPVFKPVFRSEFSMGELDFKRFDIWLRHIEHWSSLINSCDVPTLEMVQNYFAGLNVLFKNWRPIIAVPRVTTEIDNAIKECRIRKRVLENNIIIGIPSSKILMLKLVDNLDSIHTKLMDIKQVIGLGIIVRKNIGTKQKIKSGIRTKSSMGNLPES